MSDIERLRRVRLFRGLSDDLLKEIAAIVRPDEAPANRVIIQEGAAGDTLYILLEGKVQVSRMLTLKVGSRAFEERDKAFVVLDGADCPAFGEMSLIDRSPRSATVSSITPCKLLVITKEDFEALCNKNHTIGFYLLRNMAEDLSSLVRRSNADLLKLTTALSIALSR
ncbi:MAG TPA: cyclic nucleotide-binding domain-containing protein [Candidatus Xenobia bacterium]|jgi:CRP-like cAMP-binding protein